MKVTYKRTPYDDYFDPAEGQIVPSLIHFTFLGKAISSTGYKSWYTYIEALDCVDGSPFEYATQLTAELYQERKKLGLRNMTRSAKGTIGDPGKNVKAKSGLNRSILDAGLGQFSRLRNKCEYKEKTNRKKTKFVCLSCGHRDHADVNAAKNILARAMANGSKRKAVA